MKGQRKQLNERLTAFREDYRRANARINFLLANDGRGDELERLEQFVGYIDNLVDCFPESQRQVIRLCILDDIPVTSAAIEIGYHYTWTIQLRDIAVKTLEEILDGENIVRSKHGLEILERLENAANREIPTSSSIPNVSADSSSESKSPEHLQED